MDFSKAELVALLPVSDLDQAVSWYKEHLGLTPTETMAGGAGFVCGGGTMFLLYESEFAGSNKATAMAFRAADFDAAMAELRSRGVTFEEYDYEYLKTVNGVAENPDGTRSAWFKDSDGNILAIGSM